MPWLMEYLPSLATMNKTNFILNFSCIFSPGNFDFFSCNVAACHVLYVFLFIWLHFNSMANDMDP